MPVIKVETKVTGFLFNAQVWLEGREISLGYDGDHTWRSTDMINVNDGILNIIFHGQGISGTDWTLNIDQDSAGVKYEKKGTITTTGHSLVSAAEKI